ncbi:cytochrome P450 2U1-like [Haliotis rufescens]|uniref:cytochrome P450 2U1-like n=1 Tax=Haliotis rufescens TaxID=6454 RepID=UPI00201F3C46|nr:cytochrome P450 2U1-like [Haliotis rufescens]
MVSSGSAATFAAITLLAGLLMFNTSLILVCITVLLILWLSTRRLPGLPPGPPLLPLVGNIFQMDADPRVTFSKLRRQYGDIFSVYIFNEPVIVLSGYSAIKEALVKNGDVFSERPKSFLTEFFARGKGVTGTSGAHWKEQRKFALTTLRDFGMGRSPLEAKIHDELTVFLKAIEDKDGLAFDCKRLVHNAVANIICAVCLGRQFEYTDPRFVKFLKSTDIILATLGAANILNMFPIVRFIPGDFFKFKKLMQNIATVEKGEIEKDVEEHFNNYDEDNVDDFITAYIKEMKLRGSDETFDRGHLVKTVRDLFIAGTETTATTIRWTLLYFLHNPEVQEKCFREIQEHIGESRKPSMKDKTNLPYVEATISEVHRCSTIAPLAVPHGVLHNVQFRGYTFPKGVTVLPNLDSVLHDPTVWGDPQNFRPERFLDDQGKYLKRDEFIPFSMGRRVCPGESLARMELFLFLVAMIQKFQFLPDDGPLTPLKGILGITNAAPTFTIRAVPRAMCK